MGKTCTSTHSHFCTSDVTKTTKNSKPKINYKYLESRLEKWKNGNLLSIFEEAEAVQLRLKKKKVKKDANRQKSFFSLMILGKVGEAAKFIDNDDSIKGVHSLSEEIKQILLEKHPKSRDAIDEALLQVTSTPPQPIIYEAMTSEIVMRIAKNMKGTGGPTQVDADLWRHFLCSKAYGNAPSELCQAVAYLTKGSVANTSILLA